MTAPRVVSAKSNITTDPSATHVDVFGFGARTDDLVLFFISAYGPSSIAAGTGFNLYYNTSPVVLDPIKTQTASGYDLITQVIAVRVASGSYDYERILRSPGLGSAPMQVHAVVLRHTFDLTTYPLTWIDDWVEELHNGDLWADGIVYDDTTAASYDDSSIVSIAQIITPTIPSGGWITPAGTTTTANYSQWGVGAGTYATSVLGQEYVDTGDTFSYTLTPGIADPGSDVVLAWINTLYLPPGPTPVGPPARPAPQRLYLDCANTYGIWITDRTYETRVASIGWSSINWSRVLDEYSTARIAVPDELGGVYCVSHLGGLVPWKYGIVIERNDREVWKGPVKSVVRASSEGRRPRGLVVEAVDILGRYEKVPLIYGTPAEYTNDDSGGVFYDILATHSASSANGWTMHVPNVLSGVNVSRTLRASDNNSAYEVLKELLDGSVDATVVNGVLYVFEPGVGWRYADARASRTLDGPYNAAYDFVYGLFTAESYAELPGWSIAGNSQGNYVTVTSSAVGELGFAKVKIAQDEASQAEYGVVLMRDTTGVQRADSLLPVSEDQTMQSRANSLLALHSRAPAVVSGGSLAEGAPVDIVNMIPGSIWNLDIHDAGYGQLLQQGRLKRIDVTVTTSDNGVVETIAPTLQPVGFNDIEE